VTGPGEHGWVGGEGLEKALGFAIGREGMGDSEDIEKGVGDGLVCDKVCGGVDEAEAHGGEATSRGSQNQSGCGQPSRRSVLRSRRPQTRLKASCTRTGRPPGCLLGS
jgi:hypothetical protein